MNNTALNTIQTLLARCQQLFSLQKLSPTTRKLYLADIKRFLMALETAHPLTTSTLSSPSLYQAYLNQLRHDVSPAAHARATAALKQLGKVVAATYSTPNPTDLLNQSGGDSASPNPFPAHFNYIKYFLNHLKGSHLSSLTLKSYKSDITQYLHWVAQANPSNDLARLLNKKNIEKYLENLTKSNNIAPSTIERKATSLSRFQAWHLSSYGTNKSTDNKEKVALPSPSLTPSLETPTPHNQAPSRLWPLVSFSLLTILFSTLIYFGYRQFSQERVRLTQAVFPDTPTTPNRQLSFQGRLEDADGTPIAGPTTMVFKLWNDPDDGEGSELYSTGNCTIDPDTDGVFSTQIGSTCGAAITSTVFTENANVYLEVTVDDGGGAEVLSPRQQIATVAYALNSETLQGFPISSTISAIKNTVVPMNQWGEIVIGEQSPKLRGVSGTLQISAPALSIITATGTNGNISIAPDGTGQVNITGNTTSTNFFNVSNAQLTTGSLITGTVGNNNTGYKLIDLLSGSSPTSKFSVDNAGNTTLAGTLTLPNSNTLTGVTNYTQFSGGISVGGGTTYYINNSGTANLNALTVAGTLDANGQVDLGDGGDTITLNGSSLTFTGIDCSGNANGGTLTTNGSGVVTCSDDDNGGIGSGSYWNLSSNGTISPLNQTVDLLIGSTATSSAKFAVLNVNSGTPTASVSAGTSGATFLTADGYLSATQRQNLTLGNSASYNTTGNILLSPNGTGNVGIGTTTPSERLTIKQTDAFDQIWFYNGSTYTDRTTEASSTFGTTYSLLTDTNDVFYVGEASTYSLIYFDIATAGTNTVLDIEYWNGSAWTDLTTTEGTSNFTVDGEVTFSAPGDWAATSVNGSASLYYVRFSTPTADPGTNPSGYLTIPNTQDPFAVYAQNNTTLPSLMVDERGLVGINSTINASFALNVGGSIYTSTGLSSSAYIRGTGITSYSSIGSSTQVTGTHISLANANYAASLEDDFPIAVAITPTWDESTADYDHAALDIKPVINQTGTATGDYSILRIQPTITASTGTNKFLLDVGTAAAPSTLVYTEGANLGVGTSSPQSKVHIALDVGAISTPDPSTGLVVSNTGTSSNGAMISILSGNGSGSLSQLNLGDGDDFDMGGIGYYNNQDALILRANNAERLRITSTGLLGVNTTGPDARIDSLATSGEQLRLTYTDGSVYTGFTVDSNGDLSIDATGGDVTLASGDNLNLSAAGDLIFGTTSLAETTAANDSGAYLVGVFGEFANSSSANVQDVLDDLDAAITGATVGGGYWTEGSGALYPKNSTVDLLVGGTATASAKFAVLNVNSGTPTASISAGTSGSTFLTADGYLSATQRQNLTLGNSASYDTTGNILLNPNGTGYVGIGTVAPTAKLEVATAVNGDLGLSVTSHRAANSYLRVDEWAAITGKYNNNTFAYLGWEGTQEGVLRLYDAGTERIHLDSDGDSWINSTTGNVGIGTATPTNDLHLVGNQLIEQTAADTTAILTLQGTGDLNSAYLVLKDTDANISWYLENRTNVSNAFRLENYDGTNWTTPFVIEDSAPSNSFYMTSAGNVGIGDGSPSQLFVVGNGDDFQVDSNGNTKAPTLVLGTAALAPTDRIFNATTSTAITNASTYTGSFTRTLTGTTTGDITSHGLYNQLTVNATDGAFNHIAQGLTSYANLSNGNTIDRLYGGYFQSQVSSTTLSPDSNFTASYSAGLRADAFNASSGTVDTQNGLWGISYNNSTGTVNTGRGVVGSAYNNNATGTLTNGYGTYGTAFTNVDGAALTTAYGTYGQAYEFATQSTGGITTAYGGYFLGQDATNTYGLYAQGLQNTANTETFGSVYGVRSECIANGANLTITNCYGINSSVTETAGTITNGYAGYFSSTAAVTSAFGLYSNITGAGTTNYGLYTNVANAGTNWSIYTNGTANSYFGGDITLAGGNLNTGNIALVLGESVTDSITLTTDGTGNAEVVLPDDSIGPSEVFTTGLTDEYCLTYEATGGTWEWQGCDTNVGTSNWRITAGAISPINDTLDLLIGGEATASAKFAFLNVNSGTPTASVSAGTSGSTFLTANGYLSTTQRQNLTLGNSTSYNTTGNILLNPNGTGNVGIGTDTPGAKLHVAGGDILLDNGEALMMTRNTGAAKVDVLSIASGTDILTMKLPVGTGTSQGLNIINTASTSLVSILGNGSVGIGIVAPEEKLTVKSGNILIDANSRLESWNSAGTFNGPLINLDSATDQNVLSSPDGFSFRDWNANVFMTITDEGTTGNVGLGDTSPASLFTVGNGDLFQINSSGIIASIDGVAHLIDDVTGDLRLDSAGGEIILAEDDDLLPTLGASDANLGSASLPWDNLYITNIAGTGYTQGSILFAGASGAISQDNAQFFYNDADNKLGLGTLDPTAKLHVTGAVTGKALAIFDETDGQDIIVASSSGITRFRVDTAGYVHGVRFADTANSSYYIDPAATDTSIMIDGNIISNGAFSITSNATDGDITINAGAGDVIIGDGTGKMDAGTIDPPYTINGEKFATYMAGMTGVKEETTGLVQTSEYVSNLGYRTTIDFANLPKGSDLWLFSKVANLRENLHQLIVLLSPMGNTKAWYQLHPESGLLEIYSASPTSISYRLTAPRFDYTAWSNTRDSGSAGFILNDEGSWNTNDAPLAVNPTFDITTNLTAQTSSEKPKYTLVDAAGNVIKDIINSSEALIANVKSGLTQTNELQTNLISPLASGSAITMNGLVIIPRQQETSSEPLLTVEGEITASTVSARLAQFETITTNKLYAEEIVAGKITAESIQGLDARIASLSAGTTGALSEGELETITERLKSRIDLLTGNNPSASDIPTPPEATEEVVELLASEEVNLIATASATLASADIDFATINEYLAVVGQATITTLDITGNFYTESVTSKTDTLALQPLGGTVNLANNTLIVDSLTGQVAVNGNLLVSGRVLADSAEFNSLSLGSPLEASSSALGQLLAVYNEKGEAVATIDASGSANLASVTTKLITIASGNTTTPSGSLATKTTSNATAGEAVLVSPNTELTIESTFVTPNSLVYLTPTTNTDNKVLFVKSKDEKSFTVAVDSPAASDISFNWWVIELVH